MATRKAEAIWLGGVPQGKGLLKLGSGAFEGSYSFGSRFKEEAGTNPEELLGAAHAGCFSMAFAGILQQAGYAPERIHTRARVHIEADEQGFQITAIALETEARIPGLDAADFQRIAEFAKNACALSRALRNGSAAISLQARLVT